MNYLSPFHILPKGFETKAIIDKKTLKQARKVLLAEFELQGKSTIFINNCEYDKDAIFKFFDKLEKNTHLEFHNLIFQNKPLLHFLEKGQVEYYTEVAHFLTLQSKQNSDQFISFVAPYFNSHYNNLLYNALRNNNKDVLLKLVDIPFPLSFEYEANAYQASYRWYHQQLREVETIQRALENNEFVSAKQIYELIEPSFMYNFNQLPIYFFDIRDKYAFKLYELIVLLNNKHKRIELARSILDAGILLDVEERTHQYYVNADEIIDKPKGKNSSSNWVWFYIVIQFILIIIARISGCDSSSSSSSTFDFSNEIQSSFSSSNDRILENIMNNDLETLETFDSLLKEIEKTNSSFLIDTTLYYNYKD